MLMNAEQGTYRVREGDYRIVYDIENDCDRLTVLLATRWLACYYRAYSKSKKGGFLR